LCFSCFFFLLKLQSLVFRGSKTRYLGSLRRNLKYSAAASLTYLPGTTPPSRTEQSASFAENQVSSGAGTVRVPVRATLKRVEYAKGPSSSHRGGRLHAEDIPLRSCVGGNGRRSICDAMHVENEASHRACPAFVVTEAIEYLLDPIPRPSRRKHQSKDCSKLARTTAHGCAVNISFCVEDKVTIRACPILTVLEYVKLVFDPRAAFTVLTADECCAVDCAFAIQRETAVRVCAVA
jgi:hypothetical protein